MNLSLKNEVRRCRPLLGTFVEIAVRGGERTKINKAVDAAFAAMENVQRLMSFHDPHSELSRMNRLAFRQEIPVSVPMFAVLGCAQNVHVQSRGIFDVTVAPELVDSGELPAPNFFQRHKDYDGRAADIELLPGGKVRYRKPLCVDLGGIAKGFAVDQAGRVLRESGIESGLVNAGGDLTGFGHSPWPVHLRHPADPGTAAGFVTLTNASLATSANCYPPRHQTAGAGACAHVHGRTRQKLKQKFSVSVQAGSCVLADALTKIVMALGTKSTDILSKFDATALIFYPDNRVKLCHRRGNEIQLSF